MRTLCGRCRRIDLFAGAHKCTDGQNRARGCRVAIHGDRQTAFSNITPCMATKFFGAFCTIQHTHSTILGISVTVRKVLLKKNTNGMIFQNKADSFLQAARVTVESGTAV